MGKHGLVENPQTMPVRMPFMQDGPRGHREHSGSAEKDREAVLMLLDTDGEISSIFADQQCW
jgi:hypothetical protein